MKEGGNFIKAGECEIHSTAQICQGAIIGKPFRKFLDGSQEGPIKTLICEDTYIGYNTIIGNGSIIGSKTIIDDNCIIESRVTIGREGLVIYRAHICNDVKIGDQCIIGGLITERSKIGNGCRVFGKVIHLHHNPSLGWDEDDATEKSPALKDFAFIGFGATVAGDVTIGYRAYVCANAIVTTDIPDLHIASGVNQIVPYSEWKGRLKSSPFFQKE